MFVTVKLKTGGAPVVTVIPLVAAEPGSLPVPSANAV
jgi:hypothetical protein